MTIKGSPTIKVLIALWATVLWSSIHAVQPPPTGPMDLTGLPPGVTPEQYQKALEEIDTFFNNMSEEEMRDFMGFVKDLEDGKIPVEELMGPIPAQKPKTDAKPAPTPTPAPAPLPEIKQEKEKPKAPPLRNKTAAEEMLNALMYHVQSLRTKAGSYRTVSETMAPFSARLSLFATHIPSLIKKEHLERLVSDPEMLSLHDTLKSLSDVFKRFEPQVTVPEALQRLEPAVKARSQKALFTLLESIQQAFGPQHIIENIEKFFKKYEPEFLKQRKEAEEAEARARRETEAMKGWRPPLMNIKSESAYRAQPQKFQDWYYSDERSTPRSSAPSQAPSRHADDSDDEDSSPKEKQRSYESPIPKDTKDKDTKDKTDKEKIDTQKDGKSAPEKNGQALSHDQELLLNTQLAELDTILNHETQILKTLFAPFGTTFPSGLKIYLNREIGGRLTPEEVTVLVQHYNAVEEQLNNLTQVLNRIPRDHIDKVSLAVRKLKPVDQQQYTQQLDGVLQKYGAPLEAIYRAGIEFSALREQIVSQNRALDNKVRGTLLKEFLHGNDRIADIDTFLNSHPAITAAKTASPYRNTINRYIEAYELIYQPPHMKQHAVTRSHTALNRLMSKLNQGITTLNAFVESTAVGDIERGILHEHLVTPVTRLMENLRTLRDSITSNRSADAQHALEETLTTLALVTTGLQTLSSRGPRIRDGISALEPIIREIGQIVTELRLQDILEAVPGHEAGSSSSLPTTSLPSLSSARPGSSPGD